MYEPIGIDKEGNEINLLDIMESDQPDSFELYSQKQDILRIAGLMKQVLDHRESQVLCLRYGLGAEPEMIHALKKMRLQNCGKIFPTNNPHLPSFFLHLSTSDPF